MCPGLKLIHKAKPLFLVGAPRSGTTLLNGILNSHPDILLTNETAVFLQLNEMISKSYKGVQSGILYGKQEHELWAEYLESRAREMIQDYYGKIATKEGRSKLFYWGEKHPHLFLCLDWIQKHFPEAIYIYIVRDPRDSACSISAMNKVSHRKSLTNIFNFTRKYENFATQLPENRLINVRYEDMVGDYSGVTQKILDKLCLPRTPEVDRFIEKYKDVDSHKIRAFRLIRRNFKDISLGRWKKEMNQEDALFADQELGSYLEKYDYERSGYVEETPPQATFLRNIKDRIAHHLPHITSDDVITYTCNICKTKNNVSKEKLNREKKSCRNCGSSVRTRSIIHLISSELYGHSMPLPDFPVRKDIRGIGLSDWAVYAKGLSDKFNYTNTFYHKEPKLDIIDIKSSGYCDLDFLISSEVFEHVMPPVDRIFQNTHSLLKPDGFMVLTVPYMLKLKETMEHFPGLRDFSIQKKNGTYILKNTKADGSVQCFENLRFHGGQGATLELRVFAYEALLEVLQDSGFSKVLTCGEPFLEYGIFWEFPNSLPIVARP